MRRATWILLVGCLAVAFAVEADLGPLTAFSSVVDPAPMSDDAVALGVSDRIARLNALVSSYGGRLVILLPALAEVQDGSAGFMRAARALNVPALRPVPSGTFGPNLYRDAGVHLNPEGAAAFTEQLIPSLRREVTALRERDAMLGDAPPSWPVSPVDGGAPARRRVLRSRELAGRVEERHPRRLHRRITRAATDFLNGLQPTAAASRTKSGPKCPQP